MRPAKFDDALFERITSVIAAGDTVPTLSLQRPNWIAAIDRTGIWVETERSKDRGSGPQHVPAWMVAVAWEQLRENGSLSQEELLNELNVKRSAFVCALLARFSGVEVRDVRPTVLERVVSSDGYTTQPVTAADRQTGRIRIPQAAKPIFPGAKQIARHHRSWGVDAGALGSSKRS